MTIRPLGPGDEPALESLLDAAFGADRRGRTAYKVRAGMTAIEPLCFVNEEAGTLVGSIQCWPVALIDGDGAIHPLIMVGPVAVHPGRQQQGIGRALLAHALAQCDALDMPPQILIGDEPYYGLFGFSAQGTGGWQLPGPFERARLLMRNPQGERVPDVGVLGPVR